MMSFLAFLHCRPELIVFTSLSSIPTFTLQLHFVNHRISFSYSPAMVCCFFEKVLFNILQQLTSAIQTRDSSYSYIHRLHPVDLQEDFNRTSLPHDEIIVPAHHQPLNPEDEDDIIPDQHAAFGIAKATQQRREPAWRDLGLAELFKQRPAARDSMAKRLTTMLPR